jgi:hypothetical protein
MGYSIFKYGSPMLTDIEDLEQAKKGALPFVASSNSDYIEIRDSDNETVTIGYFDGKRFHWTKDKLQADAWKSESFVSKPPLWREQSEPERTSS